MNYHKLRVPLHFLSNEGVATCVVLTYYGKLGRDTHGTSTATGLWCWIKIANSDDGINSDDTFIMLMSGKLWEIIAYVLSFYVYMLLKFSTYLEVRFSHQIHQTQVTITQCNSCDYFKQSAHIPYMKFWSFVKHAQSIYNISFHS